MFVAIFVWPATLKPTNILESLGLTEIPCAFSNYQHYIEFDLGNHLLKKHNCVLLKLPIGESYSIKYTIKRIIEHAKKKVTEGLALRRR